MLLSSNLTIFESLAEIFTQKHLSKVLCQALFVVELKIRAFVSSRNVILIFPDDIGVKKVSYLADSKI